MQNDSATKLPFDLRVIRARADRMERDHECPLDPKRAGWCAKEPCGTMQTVTQLRGMADEIDKLREACSSTVEQATLNRLAPNDSLTVTDAYWLKAIAEHSENAEQTIDERVLWPEDKQNLVRIANLLEASLQSKDESGFWWCPECCTNVEPKDVTFEEAHDSRNGGCGRSVRWRQTQQAYREVTDAMVEHALLAYFDNDRSEWGELDRMGMRRALECIVGRCEYVGCDRPGWHRTHTVSGVASEKPSHG